MSWFFSKKQGVSKGEFQELIDTIKTSFSNVKTDITKIKNKAKSNDEEIQKLHNAINILNQKLELSNLQSPEQDFRQRFSKGLSEGHRDAIPIDKGESLIEKTKSPKLSNKNILNKITTVQEEILKKLAALSRESSTDLIAAKDLALEMYPETDYSQIRPMISTYLDILEEFGLVKKIRKRRQVYVELTERGESLVGSFPVTKIKFSKVPKKRKPK